MSAYNVTYNTPFDKIEVISHSAKGKINVKRILWNNTTYLVTKVVSEWNTRDGDNYSVNYTVETNRNILFQLKYDKLSLDWILVKWDNMDSK